MSDRVGQQLGKYRLDRRLGQGGFAEVYLATHVHLGTEAAIKVLHAQLATPGEMEAFRQEAQTIAKLVHPNIVRVLDFDVAEQVPYLVMDYAPNGSMRQRLPAGTRLAPQEVIPYLAQIADALQYAHDQKLVHRDIKPENMLLGRRNDVLLTDFGIAVAAQSTSEQKTMGVAGTAAYMAPEQLQGKPRPSSDLYSLAVVIYEWLAGERPFQGSFTEVASQHLFTPPPSLRQKVPGIDPAVEQVVMTALAKDPKDRFGSVRAFGTAFIQASGATGTLASFATQMIPPTPGVDQAGMALSNAVTRQGAYPPGPDAASIYGATTHITPQLTPQFSAATPSGGSVLDAPTRLTPPPSAAVPGHLAAAYVAPPMEGQVGSMPSPKVTPPAENMPPPLQGWAAQFGSVPTPEPLATFETGGAGGPIVPAPDASKRSRKRGARPWLLIAAAALLLLALIGGSVLAYSRLAGPSTSSTNRNSVTAPSGATVTITPKSSALQKTYSITAVPGTPDSSQRQIGEQQISVTTPAASSTVNATGTAYTGGSYAQGVVDVYNFDTTKPLNLAAGSSYPSNAGCAPSATIVLDADVTLQAAPAVGDATMTSNIPMHISPKGKAPGGCSPEYIMGSCSSSPCTEIAAHIVTDGTDPQPQTVVAQSDIDNAAAALEQNNQPNADQEIAGQLQSGQQAVGGTAQCSPNVTADHAAGDAASQVTVTVTFTCTGAAYTTKDATDLAAQLLKNDAQSAPGAQYAPVGQITSAITSASPGNQGTENLVVSASGAWAYQFSTTDQQNLAALIVGKTAQEARQTLLAQPGVADVAIQITSGSGQTLPTNAREITIRIKTVA